MYDRYKGFCGLMMAFALSACAGEQMPDAVEAPKPKPVPIAAQAPTSQAIDPALVPVVPESAQLVLPKGQPYGDDAGQKLAEKITDLAPGYQPGGLGEVTCFTVRRTEGVKTRCACPHDDENCQGKLKEMKRIAEEKKANKNKDKAPIGPKGEAPSGPLDPFK